MGAGSYRNIPAHAVVVKSIKIAACENQITQVCMFFQRLHKHLEKHLKQQESNSVFIPIIRNALKELLGHIHFRIIKCYPRLQMTV